MARVKKPQNAEEERQFLEEWGPTIAEGQRSSCRAVMPGDPLFECTRTRGHTGVHVAHRGTWKKPNEVVGYWVRGSD